MGQMASAIAHEIRNPLSSIRGLAQFIYQSDSEKSEQKGDLEIIIKEVDRLNQLINQLLDFSRPKKLATTKFILEDLIKEIIDLLKLESGEKKIEFHISDFPRQYIVADKDQIRGFNKYYFKFYTVCWWKGKISVSL